VGDWCDLPAFIRHAGGRGVGGIAHGARLATR
jgi:hypothetical protein